MGTIYLVRHGQAAFGTDDYDRLTETGFAQSHLLGEHLARRGLRFSAVITGNLRRHRETAAAILVGMQAPPLDLQTLPGLDEYDPDALVTALTGSAPSFVAAAQRRDPTVVREHFRLLREALNAWAEGRTQPVGMPSWEAFQAGAHAALVTARTRHPDGEVLIVSSGGPIAAAVGASLAAPPQTAVELNLRIRNTGVTEFATTPKRHQLVSFNGIAHIEGHPDESLHTYA